MAKQNTYTVHFRTDIDSAETEITARSPEAALEQARAIAVDDDGCDQLFFEPYTGCFPVNEIVVETHDGSKVAEWLDDDLLRRLAAMELLTALQKALSALNTAPRFSVPRLACDSYEVAMECERAIGKARGVPAGGKRPRTSVGRPVTTCVTPTIADRAELAAFVLDQYGMRKEGRADYDAPETMAVDLIADLLHLIRAHGDDPMGKLQTARMHFEAEAAEEKPSRKRRKKG